MSEKREFFRGATHLGNPIFTRDLQQAQFFHKTQFVFMIRDSLSKKHGVNCAVTSIDSYVCTIEKCQINKTYTDMVLF